MSTKIITINKPNSIFNWKMAKSEETLLSWTFNSKKYLNYLDFWFYQILQIPFSFSPRKVWAKLHYGRTGHYLPPALSQVQNELLKIQEFSTTNLMKINVTKTKIMIFNPSHSVDIHPAINIQNTQLEIVESMKLLGVVISSNMKWHENTDYITRRGYSRLWILRRLKQFGLSIEDLLDTYMKKVRSVLEMAVPVWHPALTKTDSA